jgi:hypothetical protein
MKEVKETLQQMRHDKALGPDGLTARYILLNWTHMGLKILAIIIQAF